MSSLSQPPSLSLLHYFFMIDRLLLAAHAGTRMVSGNVADVAVVVKLIKLAVTEETRFDYPVQG
jgi:hypothetical protein